MGVMIDTPIGKFKNLIVDTVSKLEDSMAHFMEASCITVGRQPLTYVEN